MEEEIGYIKLYKLQDEVLEIVFGLENSFYLTGGTALHRFYYNNRYSDDLDFFVYNDNIFGESVYEVIDALTEQEYRIEHTVKAKDFHRLMVNDSLQLDFVNDRVHREGKSKSFNSIRVDNKINILANKVTAIIGRDEEKDFFDLFCLAQNESFSWKDILKIANKKSVFDKEVLIYRLESFPLSWLNNIKTIHAINITKEMVEKLTNDILLEENNSFFQKKTKPLNFGL